MMDMYGKGKTPVTTTRMAARTLCAAFVLVLLAGGECRNIDQLLHHD
jgi:hypothetical protein